MSDLRSVTKAGRRADSILEELEHAIVVGEFVDGDRLDEMKLCERFGVSRTPLREVFQKLAAAGLLDLIPRRGAFVRHPAFVELVEMFEVMAELEAMCGRLAGRRMTQAMLNEIKESAAGCEAALKRGESNEYYRENERFHHLIYEASGNAFLAAEASRLHKRLKSIRRMQLLARGRMEQSMAEHRGIVAAFQSGTADEAAAALRLHVSIQGEKFNDLIASYSKRPVAKAV